MPARMSVASWLCGIITRAPGGPHRRKRVAQDSLYKLAALPFPERTLKLLAPTPLTQSRCRGIAALSFPESTLKLRDLGIGSAFPQGRNPNFYVSQPAQRSDEFVRCAQDRLEVEAVGAKDTGAPVDVGHQLVKMVLIVVVMLSRHRLSLARVGAVTTTQKSRRGGSPPPAIPLIIRRSRETGLCLIDMPSRQTSRDCCSRSACLIDCML
jgi:hypothetical protein